MILTFFVYFPLTLNILGIMKYIKSKNELVGDKSLNNFKKKYRCTKIHYKQIFEKFIAVYSLSIPIYVD